MKIPTAVHESNAVPGLTTRMVADQVDRIMVCFEESREYYHNKDRVAVVGMPVREAFIYRRRDDARRELGLDERPFVVSCWGSLGARESLIKRIFVLEGWLISLVGLAAGLVAGVGFSFLQQQFV